MDHIVRVVSGNIDPTEVSRDPHMDVPEHVDHTNSTGVMMFGCLRDQGPK